MQLQTRRLELDMDHLVLVIATNAMSGERSGKCSSFGYRIIALNRHYASLVV
jgi:hypothetical protein